MKKGAPRGAFLMERQPRQPSAWTPLITWLKPAST